MRIVVDNRIPYLRGVLEPFGQVEYLEGYQFSKNSIASADAIIIRTRTACDEKLLAGTDVRFVGTATIGTDHIDTDWCDYHNIKWANAPGCNSGSVMQYIAAALLSLSFKHNFSLPGKTIGIVGVGNVGSKVEKMAKALGMRALLNDPPRERVEGGSNFVSIERLKKESDIITFHVPLTKSGPDPTLCMAGEEFFRDIKSGAIIINSSRGGVVDEEILIRNLKTGHVKGAVIDVWEREPNPDRELLSMCDIATPHIAGYSLDGKYSAARMIVEQFAEHYNLEFDPETIINPPAPENSIIELNDELTAEEQIRKAILTSYNILSDDHKLRENPDKFETIRNNYWLRREFNAYKIAGEGASIQTLLDLGFNI